MTEKSKSTMADPLAEQEAIMGRHLKGQSQLSKTERQAVANVEKALPVKLKTGKKTSRQDGKLKSQQISKEPLDRVTFRVPGSLLQRFEDVQHAMKKARRHLPKTERKVFTQDLFNEALADWVQKKERKYKLN